MRGRSAWIVVPPLLGILIALSSCDGQRALVGSPGPGQPPPDALGRAPEDAAAPPDAPDVGGDARQAEAGVDASALEGGGDRACIKPMKGAMAPCNMDSDCDDAFLVCRQMQAFGCRSPDPSDPNAVPSCFQWNQPTDLPICPDEAQVILGFCWAKYQLPCHVDSDCGPAGFSCSGSGTCNQTGSGPCTTDSDCPQEWSCYAPCPCPTGPPGKLWCYPPFAEFNCPACLVGPFDGGADL
jgi:hypothetical protein